MKLNIAIIGAGICGLTVAKNLNSYAHVTVFEKSRGLGGRIATRYHQNFEFDHGVPYFTCSDPSLIQTLQSSVKLQPWFPRFIQLPQQRRWQTEVWVSCPRMNSWAKELAANLTLRLSTQISKIERNNKQSILYDQAGFAHGPFDWVICTVPWPQAKNLFGEHLLIEFSAMQTQYVYMLGFSHELKLDFDVALLTEGGLDKIVVNSAKPGRQHLSPSIVVYAKQELNINQVIQDYLPVTPCYIDQHFWRYAHSTARQKHDILFSADLAIVLGGDWLRPVPGVEASFAVAQELTQFILGGI